MTDIYLCRHGRTPLNVAGLLRGRLDPGLDLVGHAEARALGEQLRDVGLTRVISSPLARAVETATPIAAASGLDVETDARLLDRDYGEFDGRSADEVRREFGSLDAAPGVEPTAAVEARAQSVLDDLVAAGGAGPVAVVSHEAVIRLLLDKLSLTPGHTEQVQPRTGSWSLLRHDGRGWRLVTANSVEDPIETELAFRPGRRVASGERPERT